MKLVSKKSMKYRYFWRVFLVAFIVVVVNLTAEVNANIMCNDGTVSPSCVDCHQGCCSHHGGCAVGNSSNNSANNSNRIVKSKKSSSVKRVKKVVPKVIKKSSNNKLKKVVIDGDAVLITNNMKYTTTEDTIYIRAVTADGKANVKYNDFIDLKHGDNVEVIEVIAENGVKKTYYITIKKINDNNEISRISIDGNEVSLQEMKYETINNSIDIDVIPKDQYATVNYQKQVNLNPGDNTIIISVVAENGDTKEYSLLVSYNDDVDDIAGVVASTIITGGAGAAIATGIYHSRKRKNKNLSQQIKCQNCKRINSTDDVFCIYCGKELN